jgi:hypothetical protein
VKAKQDKVISFTKDNNTYHFKLYEASAGMYVEITYQNEHWTFPAHCVPDDVLFSYLEKRTSNLIK